MASSYLAQKSPDNGSWQVVEIGEHGTYVIFTGLTQLLARKVASHKNSEPNRQTGSGMAGKVEVPGHG